MNKNLPSFKLKQDLNLFSSLKQYSLFEYFTNAYNIKILKKIFFIHFNSNRNKILEFFLKHQKFCNIIALKKVVAWMQNLLLMFETAHFVEKRVIIKFCKIDPHTKKVPKVLISHVLLCVLSNLSLHFFF